MHFAKTKLFNASQFQQSLTEHTSAISAYKAAIKNALEQIRIHQSEGISAVEIINKYAWFIDQIVMQAWQQHSNLLPKGIEIELLAVGGYGRSELHPFSDVDLLILLASNDYESAQPFIEAYVRFLWDIGLEVGHSVRSIKDCQKEARQDITTMTNMLEARHLTGDASLFTLLDDKLRHGRIWPSDRFFEGKYKEQMDRYKQYDDTAYTLEPNLKEGAGGLRDLQTILWIYNRRYGIKTFKEMNEQGFINDDEYRILTRDRNVLWKLRTGLHLLNNRREDRLLFDSQRELASEFGYQDTENHLAVEQLMKRYYRTVKDVLYLSDVLLSNYRINNNNRFLMAKSKIIDDDFVMRNKLIEARDPAIFEQTPSALLRLFVLMQKHRITAIHPETIRSLRANLTKIDHEFRHNDINQQLFLDLFKDDGVGLTNTLDRMNLYGVLGAYLPSFGAIVGQMQHDLFHVYTVDGHTLMVIKKLVTLRLNTTEFPVGSDILARLYKPERLFLGALFHDIAKGRGGDHSVLGESDAYEFCIEHGLNEYDAKLVGWLVLNHLIMSHFSQRRDISDPDVIKEFADIVGDIEHLDNLYLLTLADIRGTSPKVWNAWKGQLLLDLYQATRQALRRGIAKPINEEQHVKDDKTAALELLNEQNINLQHVEEFWQTLSNDYFIRNDPYYIAWHIKSLSRSTAIGLPIVSMRYSERLQANMLFVFAPESQRLLTQVTASFNELDLNIIEARLQSTSKGFALYSFNVLVPEVEHAKKRSYMRFLEEQLRKLILDNSEDKIIYRKHTSRALKHFPIQPHVSFTFNHTHYTVMDVLAQDQPALLHNVACALQHHNIKLASAKIATFGERAEDVFFIESYQGEAVTDKATLESVKTEITNILAHQKP